MAGMMSGDTLMQPNTATGQDHRFTLTALTSLFFMWGFITCLNDILIPHLKAVFSLSYTEAMLIQFCFFGAYFLVSLPAGALVKRIGYKQGIVSGLLIAAAGCLVFYPAAGMQSYPVFLSALFILASGITVLQVSANPYVAVLGNPETASSRLTLTQGFNALGTTVAPTFGAILILAGAEGGAEMMADASHGADSVKVPYLILAGALVALAVIFSLLKLPEVSHAEETAESQTVDANQQPSAWAFPHLVLGAIAIFVYVGAEVSIGSFLVNFIGEDNITGLPEAEAAKYITYYWGGAMVGRFIGAAVMQKIAAGSVLAFNSVCACVLLAVAVLSDGYTAMWAILAVGLCNSIMFPTIFSLAIHRLGIHTSQGSGILCLAIVGGALIPLLQGVLADNIGVQLAFVMPIACYLYIAFFGLKGCRT